MVKIDLPGVNTTRKRTKQGWRYYYYHRASKERLPDDPASPEFVARLQELNDQYKQPETRKIIPGSFAALIAAYKESRDFRSLKPRSRVSYTRYLSVIEENWGRNKVSAITREAVFNLRDAYEDTPRTANFVIQVLRLLLNYALDRPSVYGLSFNPAVRPKKLKTGEGYRPWEDHEIAAFRAKWAPDTLQRVAFEIMLNTGQRRGDVVRMARNQYRKGWVSLTQEKTGRKLEIPASQDLVAVLEPWLTAHEHLVILTNQNKLKGKALSDKIGRQRVTCEEKDIDRYKRIVAVCRIGKIDLNAWMVEQGHAVAYHRYSKDYVQQEETAKAQKVGVWQGEFTLPWEWRKVRRKK